MTTFSEILDAAGSLTTDEQETLLEILRRRVAERKRGRVIHDVEEAREEFSDGQARPASVDDIMDEVNGEA